ncbi:MAG: hypothetical protein KatS3mg102_0113 [Planctomycetota bacterium]|nr:MAG: hypothetical protein KatS3mg102_0113 [Planctomycetota bacterium]
MEFRIDTQGRELTAEEKAELERDLPHIRHTLQHRFGKVRCAEHGEPALTAVLEVGDFPEVTFTFEGACCEQLERDLLAAAKAR